MSGLYPSLEDLAVDQMARDQLAAAQIAQGVAQAQAQAAAAGLPVPAAPASLYAGLGLEELLGTTYLGLDLSEAGVSRGADLPLEVVQAQAMALRPPTTLATAAPLPGSQAIARVTPVDDRGMQRAAIHQGVKPLAVVADAASGKLGLATRSVDNGVFVSFVWSGSPAAKAGLRFGDQILQINDEFVAGWDEKKTFKALTAKKEAHLVLRERPFCRTITVQKDSHNHIGFLVKNGEVTTLVKDSSAARNGLLINHRLIEINGQNVVGMPDKDIIAVIQASPRTVTVTVLPTFIYNHLVKKIGSSMIKKYMDHSIPEI